MKSIVYLLNFRSTAIIENFNNIVLKYASKRIAYRYDAYKARNQLAALDYTYHKDRPARKKKNGEIVYKRKFNKCSNRWTTYQDKVDKTYPHIPGLMRDIIRRFENKEMDKGRKFDPKTIAPTIAPVPAPKVADLVAAQRSRFT